MEIKHIEISPEDSVYVIGVVSKLLNMPEWTLRTLEKEGLIRPKRMGKKNRMYSMNDIRKLEYIHYLMDEKGVNINGIRIILEIED